MSCFVSKCIYVLCKSSIAYIYNELRITKEPLDESEKAGFKLNIQKTKIMASGPITSWQTDGETVTIFILGGSKITADGDWSHEIKGQIIAPWKKIEIYTSRNDMIIYIDYPKQWKQCQTLFFWAPKSLQMVTAAMKLKDAYSLEGKLWPT